MSVASPILYVHTRLVVPGGAGGAMTPPPPPQKNWGGGGGGEAQSASEHATAPRLRLHAKGEVPSLSHTSFASLAYAIGNHDYAHTAHSV